MGLCADSLYLCELSLLVAAPPKVTSRRFLSVCVSHACSAWAEKGNAA